MRGRQELAAEGRRRCARKQSDVDPSHPRLSSAAARYGVWSRRAAGERMAKLEGLREATTWRAAAR